MAQPEKNVSAEATNAPKVLSTQEQIDATKLATAEIERQIAEAKLFQLKEELEDLKTKNDEARQRRDIQRQRLLNNFESDKRRKEDEARKQAYCNHTQGGEGLEGLYQGDGIQSTYQKETDVLGHESYRCIRCGSRVHQLLDPDQFKAIKKLPHKGLVGPIPVIFKYVDGAGNTVTAPAIIIPE